MISALAFITADNILQHIKTHVSNTDYNLQVLIDLPLSMRLCDTVETGLNCSFQAALEPYLPESTVFLCPTRHPSYC